MLKFIVAPEVTKTMPISPKLTYEESMINCNIWKKNMDFANKWDFHKLLNIR